METTEQIGGYTCNLVTSKEGSTIRQIAILIGAPDEPGTRLKDPGAKAIRREAREAVIAAIQADPRAAWLLGRLASDRKLISVVSRYSCLQATPDGLVERRDDSGKVIGAYRI